MFFKKRTESIIDDCFDYSFNLGVSQLRLGLAFKLRMGKLDTDNGC